MKPAELTDAGSVAAATQLRAVLGDLAERLADGDAREFLESIRRPLQGSDDEL